MKQRSPVDWEAVEREYRAGQLSVREIGRMFDVSHTAIEKKAKANGWTRDLAKKVRAEVANRLVAKEVTNGNAREAVETAVLRGVEVIGQHRSDIGRARKACSALVAELEEATANRDQIEAAIEQETEGDNSGKRRAMMLRAVSLPSRATTISNLSVALKNLVTLERQAFNLNESPEDPNRGGFDHPVTDEDRARALGAFLAKTKAGNHPGRLMPHSSIDLTSSTCQWP